MVFACIPALWGWARRLTRLAISLTCGIGRKRWLSAGGWAAFVTVPAVSLRYPSPLPKVSTRSDNPPVSLSYFPYFKLLRGFLSCCGNWYQQLRFRNAIPKEWEASELDGREKRPSSTQAWEFLKEMRSFLNSQNLSEDIKIKNFCESKDMISRLKRWQRNWRGFLRIVYLIRD